MQKVKFVFVREWNWRPACRGDIEAIDRIQCTVHRDHAEAPEVLLERLELCPEGCFVLEQDETICGYVLSHPWIRRSPPPIDTLLGSIPDASDIWYLHDLALLLETRGSGAGSGIAALLARQAKHAGYETAALISINGSQGFWQRQGFSAHREAALAHELATYGGQAVYMEKDLFADAIRLSA